jgi:hypothetical protein
MKNRNLQAIVNPSPTGETMKPFSQLPEALALTERINTKSAALAKIISDIDEIVGQIAAGHQNDNHDRRVQAALEYVATGDFTVPTAANGALQEKHSYLCQQVEALKLSITADRDDLHDFQRQASAKASLEVDAKHRSIAADALKAIRAFDAACAAEQALVSELGENGYDARFRHPIQWFHIGRLNDISSSAIWYYERSLALYLK